MAFNVSPQQNIAIYVTAGAFALARAPRWPSKEEIALSIAMLLCYIWLITPRSKSDSSASQSLDKSVAFRLGKALKRIRGRCRSRTTPAG